ncbi:hypothetical protein J3F83DRAFT_715661 [Trichoderma novae-zelandiae]
MKFSLFAIAALPALALAQSTTTETSTTVLTKTVTLKKVHVVTSISSPHNATTTSSHHYSVGTAVSTTSLQPTAAFSTGAPVASATATKGPQNAGVALEASKVALAGVAGMIIVALM